MAETVKTKECRHVLTLALAALAAFTLAMILLPATPAAGAPAPVTITGSSDIGQTSATIKWSESTDADFSYYEVHFSTNRTFIPDNTTRLGTITTANITSMKVDGLTHSTTYYFRVRTFNLANESADSTPLQIKTSVPPVKSGGFCFFSIAPFALLAIPAAIFGAGFRW